MSKQATYIEEQIQLMQERGMVIIDTNKAKEILLDVGYYRLGFYTYPFELYPNVNPRSHQYKPGTDFNQIIELYYFDHDLRHVLLKYISRIEVNLRTFITYTCSNYYKSNPTWFVSPKAVTRKFRQEFEQKISLKLQIAQHYGLNTIALFENYLQTIKVIRNACAHGNHIFDLQLIKAVKKGPLANYDDKHRHNIYSVLLVVLYFLHIISENREEELKLTLKEHIQTYKNRDHVTILNDFLQNIL